MTIEENFDIDNSLPHEPPRQSHNSFTYTPTLRSPTSNNTRRRRCAQTSLFDFLPQPFRDKYDDSDYSNEDWGATYREQENSTIWVWYTNPNGLEINPSGTKLYATFSFLFHKSQAGIISFAETNLNWPLLQYGSRLNNRLRSFYREFYSVTSNNKHEEHGKTQRGGTCTFEVNQIVYRIHRSGNDSTGMGRWS